MKYCTVYANRIPTATSDFERFITILRSRLFKFVLCDLVQIRDSLLYEIERDRGLCMNIHYYSLV
jgi:hypothetical protein